MADRLIECVPNFSEGRRSDVLGALAAPVQQARGVYLLDHSADPDHNRSVLTFAGAPDAVTRAMEATVGVALEKIDMRSHAGQHPRIGAVDVIPFVPLGDTTMDEAVELARALGQRLGQRFELPIYLYGRAALRPGREVLADIRRPQFEGLAELISQPDHAPDYGPPRLHPTAGATAVGARPFLIAYNVNLDSPDIELARRIAGQVRERSGGLPRVQALGLYLDELGCAQVSMNLLDHTVTPMWRVWQAVQDLALADGVTLRESELIGLCPLRALLDVADHVGVDGEAADEVRITVAAEWLRIRDFRPTMALELRLAAARGASA
jgi:glutamate formiminotransferase / 5-formyltetrahydrofolate cyclo-ligase